MHRSVCLITGSCCRVTCAAGGPRIGSPSTARSNAVSSGCCSQASARAASTLALSLAAPDAALMPAATASMLAVAVQPATPLELYMRELPGSCIDWSSDAGRKLFREALGAGDMECYFPLAAQFTTQAEPAYCGLGTLAMVLNALNIDPGRVWKGVWRWYHEGMLDCCVPLDVVQQKGISMDTFACLARCNGAAATVVRVPSQDCHSTPEGKQEFARGLEAFRVALKSAVRNRAGSFLVSSYSRAALGQTGEGHFSPLAGYHEEADRVLVLDVARFKYPPHWVGVETLYRAMQHPDPDTGRARGYVTVHRSAAVPLVLFAFGQAAGANGPAFHTHSASGECCGSSVREGAVLGTACSGNCSGQGMRVSDAAGQLATAMQAIDSAPLHTETGTALPPIDAALHTAVQFLLCPGQGAAAMSGTSPLLALSASGDGLSLTDEATCLTRLSREQVSAAAALLADVEKLPLYRCVRRALSFVGESRQSGGRGWGDGSSGRRTSNDIDPTIATLAVGPSDREEEGDHARVGEAGSVPSTCAHEPQSCVRVHTAHVLTTLLLTMYAQTAGQSVDRVGVAGVGEGPYERLVLEYEAAYPQLVQGGPRACSVGPVLRGAVAASLACASPLVRAEVALLRGQLVDSTHGQ